MSEQVHTKERREALQLNLAGIGGSRRGMAGSSSDAAPVLTSADLTKALATPDLEKKFLDILQSQKYETRTEQPTSSQAPAPDMHKHPPNIPADNNVFRVPHGLPNMQFQNQAASGSGGVHSSPPQHGRNRPGVVYHHQMGEMASTSNRAVGIVRPIDPFDQEKLKVDRKRERNRQAAQRCREKKLKMIDTLTEDVHHLEQEREILKNNLQNLRDRALDARALFNEHQSAGCDVSDAELCRQVEIISSLDAAVMAGIIAANTVTAPASSHSGESGDEDDDDD